jgi:hypothetical protein
MWPTLTVSGVGSREAAALHKVLFGVLNAKNEDMFIYWRPKNDQVVRNFETNTLTYLWEFT